MRNVLLVVLAAAAGLALVSCGGGKAPGASVDTSSSDNPPTAAERTPTPGPGPRTECDRKAWTGEVSVASASFGDAANGWVLARGGTEAGGECWQVARTTDGGDTWAWVTIPERLHRGAGTAGIVATGASSALAYGGEPWGTNDGGLTWELDTDLSPQANCPAEVSACLVPGPMLARRGPGEAWVAVNDVGGPRLYATTDGGSTWHPRPIPP